MMSKLVLLASFGVFWWLIKKDIGFRKGVSSAIWIPTLWVGMLASRPLSTWVGFGGGGDTVEGTLEGSPVDRLFYFILIGLALVTVSRRRLDWGAVMRRNWPICLFYGYLLITVVWSDSPVASFKRWFKEVGNIFVLLVVLTEEDPQEAFRAVFVRCACVLIPLSVVFIRYFPDLGRVYNIHSGEMEAVGVTFQKNSLGAMVLVCGLVLIWEWFERSRPGAMRWGRVQKYLPAVLLGMGVYLVRLCDSKTSIACLGIAGCLMAATRLPLLRRRISALGTWTLVAVLALFALDSAFGIREEIVRSMGRDMTFTGRTEVWQQLLSLDTNPIFGTGFCSFWSDQDYMAKLPIEIVGGRSAHNGYLENYIDGGVISLFFLGTMLLVTFLRINRQLSSGSNYAVMRFAVLAVVLIANVSESHFGKMSPLGFLFLLAAVDPLRAEAARAADEVFPGRAQPSEELPASAATVPAVL
jgi:O-antigen ligase